MSQKLLQQFINETLRDRGFIKHLQNGLTFGNGQLTQEAQQIVSDWLEEVEVSHDILLAPGHVTQLERFAVRRWPEVSEQFRGNRTMALVALSNELDDRFYQLVGEG
jgi:hypothetical protein